ncbi:MAG: 3-oxoacyl-ACP reductase [Candidatus Marinimicrobia bacterium]|nr:3-oxoacyl-ACP reductase [Candidatus Neomarinimicrobiota bacterium]|tara:strand:- start:9950 stop:10714 length:765 start_codon:yes stop_codon:yes gene_type:complete
MNNWALILGASSGIGVGCARQLAQKGINIYGVYLRKKKDYIATLEKELSSYNVQVIYKKANIANSDNRQIIINELKEISNIRIKFFIHSVAFGTLKKIICNDDGLNHKNITMTSDVMCNSLVYWCQDLYHSNLFQKGSHILSMTSAGGRKNWDSYGAVSMAKAGLEAATRQLAIELAPFGISANAIQAGTTDTEALRKIPGSDKMIQSCIDSNPHKRLTTPNDIAEFITLLINYNSSWMTGNIIRLDGAEDITN